MKQMQTSQSKARTAHPSSRPAAGRTTATQQPAGNRSILRLLQAGVVQAKLAAPAAGNSAGVDAAEREADQAAALVALGVRPIGLASQPRRTGSTPHPASGLPGLGAGSPLSVAVRARFEDMFGWDFGRVRLHSGPTAAEVCSGMGARAFTSGSHIVFGNKVDNPENASHQHLLAHELAHVVQQDKAMSTVRTPAARPGMPAPLAASLSPAPAGQAQAAPLVTAVAGPGELGVGRQIRVTATVARGAGPLTWRFTAAAPAGVTITPSGNSATVRSAAAPNPHPAAGTVFTVRAERTAAAGDGENLNVTLVGLVSVALNPAPAFANQPLVGGGVAAPPAAPALPVLGGVADPNRGGLAGNTLNVVTVTAPAGRDTTVTLPSALGSSAAADVITPGSATGNALARVTENITGTRLDVPFVIQPVPLFLGGFGAVAATPAGVYGAAYPLRFQSSDTTGTLNRPVGETIVLDNRDDFGFPINPPIGPNPNPTGALAARANGWTDQLFRPIGAVAGAAGDANVINVNRFEGPGVAVPLPAIQSLRQGFHFQGWGGLWSDEFDHGLHVRSLRRSGPAAFIFRTEFPFSRVRGPVRDNNYTGPPLIRLSAITLNTMAAPAAPLAAGGLAADGVALGGVTVATTVAGRTVNWSVLNGPIAFTAGAAAAPVAGAATLQSSLVAGNFQVRVADTVFPNRRADGRVRIVPVLLRNMRAPVSTIATGTLTAVVNVTADPGGRNVDWTVDPAARARGVTVAAAAVAGPAAAAAARSATVTRPAAFTGRVTVTAADHVRPGARTSTTITFR